MQQQAKRVKTTREPFRLGGVEVLPGRRATVDLPVTLMSTHTPLTLPVQVVHGRSPGAVLFVCGAIHGDELNGVETIRRLLHLPVLSSLRGTLLAVPVVNVFGFLHRSRYLPDRRDLNRSFPGSPNGSLAAQLASLFMDKVVSLSTHGIDLHTGAVHRSNFPHIRGRMDCPLVKQMAEAFGAPLILDATLRPGTLRLAAGELNIPVITYEAGEALRYEEMAIRAGVAGVVGVMRSLGMLRRAGKKRKLPVTAKGSTWVRAPESGILRPIAHLGKLVEQDAVLGWISDPMGEREFAVRASVEGVVVGISNLPLANRGDALFHLAMVQEAGEARAAIKEFQGDLLDDNEYIIT